MPGAVRKHPSTPAKVTRSFAASPSAKSSLYAIFHNIIRNKKHVLQTITKVRKLTEREREKTTPEEGIEDGDEAWLKALNDALYGQDFADWSHRMRSSRKDTGSRGNPPDDDWIALCWERCRMVVRSLGGKRW